MFLANPATRAVALSTVFLAATASAETVAPRAEARPAFARVLLSAELGFLGAAHHRIQYGKNGTSFDYVNEGGQKTLFPFVRLSAELHLARRHSIILLYQPLAFASSVRLHRDILVDELRFPQGTGVDLRYGFDFYRISYLYDVFGRPGSRRELSFGLSLQIRNATVVFTSTDGSLQRSFSNIGPVPTLKVRGGYLFRRGVWLAGEADFMYAPVKYLNGGSSDVEGAIFDVNLRAGYRVRPTVDFFLNFRYLGGGASGTSPDENTVGDGYVSNWLHFFTLSIGATWSSAE
jgi:hypothetical protein